jgi:predicted nucleic acid-binding protein
MGLPGPTLLESYGDAIAFYAPDVCFEDTRKYIVSFAERRRVDHTNGLVVLAQIEHIVETVDRSLYEAHESPARSRVALRDPQDWLIVAEAMLLECPIWTEDRDFFAAVSRRGPQQRSNSIFGEIASNAR